MSILEYKDQLQVILMVNEEENQREKISSDPVKQITLMVHLEVLQSE